jgi:hypothetical protein
MLRTHYEKRDKIFWFQFCTSTKVESAKLRQKKLKVLAELRTKVWVDSALLEVLQRVCVMCV